MRKQPVRNVVGYRGGWKVYEGDLISLVASRRPVRVISSDGNFVRVLSTHVVPSKGHVLNQQRKATKVLRLPFEAVGLTQTKEG